MPEHVPWPATPSEPGPWAGGPPSGPVGQSAPRRHAPAVPGVIGPSGTPGPAPSSPAVGGVGGPAFSDFPDPLAQPAGPRVPVAGLPSTGLGRVDRAPASIIALSALVVAALVAGSAYLVVRGKPDFPKYWDSRVAPIAAWVAKARNLDFKHPVEVDFLNASEYSVASRGDQAPDAETKRQMDDTVAQMRAFGFVQGDVDLEAANDTLNDTGTLAYYDPSSKRILVRGTTITPSLRVTLAHELVHVLQDQHFDLSRMQGLPENQTAGFRALAEGDAERIETRYVSDALTPAERAAYQKESSASGDAAKGAIDKKVPEALTALFAAPYAFGPSLVAYLEREGGDEAVNAAFDAPPTDEVLFNPQLSNTAAAVPLKVEVEAPGGTEKIDSGQFGPTAWYLLLASRLSPIRALKATDGFGGDAYVVYREQTKVCVRAYAVGDDTAQTTELAAALKLWAAQSPAGTASVTIDAGRIRFQSCDPGPKVKVPGKVTLDLLVLPVTRTQVFVAIAKGGTTEEVASCVAGRIVERFTVGQLIDDAYLGSAPAQAVIQQVKGGCG